MSRFADFAAQIQVSIDVWIIPTPQTIMYIMQIDNCKSYGTDYFSSAMDKLFLSQSQTSRVGHQGYSKPCLSIWLLKIMSRSQHS